MKSRSWMLGGMALMGFICPPVGVAASQDASDDGLGDWFDDPPLRHVPQTEGRLLFLAPSSESDLPHATTRFEITPASLSHGWVGLTQCHEGLDAVAAAEVVYAYRGMRQLRVQSASHIGRTAVQGQSVQLHDVGRDASLCVVFEARVLHPLEGGEFVMRNGPYHRRFLDGYFPMRVSMDVRYPSALLQPVRVVPAPQQGFAVRTEEGRVQIEAWFAGKLSVEMRFMSLRSEISEGG